MKIKKLLALILGAAMCAAVSVGVAACGDSNEDDAGTQDSETQDSETTDSETQDKTEISNSDYVGKTYKVVEENLKYYYYDKEVTVNSADGYEAEVYADGVDTVQAYYEGLTLTFDGDGESIKLTISDSIGDMGTGTAKYALVDGWFVFTDASGSVSNIAAETWLSSVSFGYDGENVIFYVVYRESAEIDSDGNVAGTTVIAYAQGAMEEAAI